MGFVEAMFYYALAYFVLPKTRDERCVPQAWDEFESPCDFAQLPLTTADVASPMCEVCRIVPAPLECLLWACNVREGLARPLDMSHHARGRAA